jgi:L-seryl-tRNA(Ser) seleniumtransferase
MHRLLAAPEAAALLREHPRGAVADALRRELDKLRREGRGFAAAPVFAAAGAALDAAARPGLRRAINATGVVLHTNLGRAPLPAAALVAIAAEAGGTCNLELDLESGRRGHRDAACAALLAELTGAEAALVVNNGAAAVLLALTALAAGGEAVVSRGELVEIGGGFRIPDVIRQGGARLVEVGTTNRTRLADFEGAIGPETRLLLRVHPSNYRITGFTAAPAPAEIAALARARGLLSLEDLGGGALLDLSRLGLPREPTLADSVAAGFDLVTASGDKLLGGPQAGLVLGRREVVARLAAHPLMRALRPGKLTLAALEAVLRLYRDPARVVEAVPVLAMFAAPLDAVAARAERLRALLPEAARAEVGDDTALVGGGALPEAALPTRVVALPGAAGGPEALARRLRLGRPAVVGRIAGGRLLLDLRTVAEEEVEALAAAVRAALPPSA